MIVNVGEHKLTIDKSPVNELEVNVTKVEFVFDEKIPSNYVKKAFFTNGDVSKVIELVNDECNIPSEVLHKKGQVRLGVIAYEVQDDTLIERFNPTPTYFEVWEGSMVEADNTEPITPTDKEQIEQQLLNISTQMDNIDIEAEKIEHTTTIIITRKDGTSYEVEVLDGEKGDKGDKGDAGSIKFIIVETLPTENIDESAIYLTPSENPDLKNHYDEWIWVTDRFEPLGETQIEVDLTDYVKNTDYANNNNGGVIKTASGFIVNSNGFPYANEYNYASYVQLGGTYFIGKGTLENVITGKGLVSNTDYPTSSVGGVIKVSGSFATNKNSNGYLISATKTYTDYTNADNNMFISKGTLENVLTATIGDIGTILDNINNEVL